MTDNRITDDSLEEVTGGRHHHHHDTSNATNMDHNLEHFSSKKKHCPYCGADATDEMFRFGEGVVHNGQRCTRDSSHMWIYGDRVH